MASEGHSTLHIAAGGESSRLRPYMVEMGYPDHYPKHLLPTGHNGETFLGRNIRQARAASKIGPIIVHTNIANHLAITHHAADIDPSVEVKEGAYDSWIEPMVKQVVEKKTRSIGSAGDMYVESFDWDAMIEWHEQHGNAVTFLVGQTVAVESGLIYHITDDFQITGFSRVERTRETDYINIGAYIIDEQHEVLRILTGLVENRNGTKMDEHKVVQDLIDADLVGAYISPGVSFNVNTPSTYEAVVKRNSAKQLV